MLLRKIRVKIVCGCEKKKRLSWVWFVDIYGLQFEIMREVFYYLVLQFGDLLSLDTLQLLDLLCDSLFGSCTIRIWYLVFVNIWFFGLYLRERVIWMYLRFGFVRVPLHQFILSQIFYSKICSLSLVNVGDCRTT